MLGTKPAETKSALSSVDKAWDEISVHFRNSAALVPSGFWFSGLSERTAGNRLAILRGKQRAKAASRILGALTSAELREFQTLAFVNFEQASASLRVNIVTSISIPVGLLVIFNQVFPGELAALFEGPTSFPAWAPIIAALLWLLLNMCFGYAGVHQARDLYHLTLIEAAQRGVEKSDHIETKFDLQPDVSEVC
ncbi:MAG: hypothetical protein AAGD92_14680 [Pseudomonadota bacterium]